MKFVQAKTELKVHTEKKQKKNTLSGSYGGDSNKVCVLKARIRLS